MQIEVVKLKRYFGSTRAVDGLSFSFQGGQIWGFVGPNGAGKTTTMRVMATLDEPTAGDVLLDGVSVVQDPEKARALTGFVPDSLPTHSDIDVHEYLDFFARAYGVRDPRRKRVVESIEKFTNLLGIREKPLKALSKGMKQRVNLARALVHDPPVLIMDEPAAGLDPRARIELRELVKALAEQGKAILISSHILSELSEMIDGVVIIEQGKMLRAGDLDGIRTADVGGVLVLLRTLDNDHETLCSELLETPHVEKVSVAGGFVRVALSGREEHAAELLRLLITRGHRVVEFRHETGSLEEVFMKITRGEVS